MTSLASHRAGGDRRYRRDAGGQGARAIEHAVARGGDPARARRCRTGAGRCRLAHHRELAGQAVPVPRGCACGVSRHPPAALPDHQHRRLDIGGAVAVRRRDDHLRPIARGCHREGRQPGDRHGPGRDDRVDGRHRPSRIRGAEWPADPRAVCADRQPLRARTGRAAGRHRAGCGGRPGTCGAAPGSPVRQADHRRGRARVEADCGSVAPARMRADLRWRGRRGGHRRRPRA